MPHPPLARITRQPASGANSRPHHRLPRRGDPGLAEGWHALVNCGRLRCLSWPVLRAVFAHHRLPRHLRALRRGAVATPHQGVPKAMDWLVNGVRVGRVALRRMTEVSREWPGVYDLLPRYPAVLAPGQAKGRGRDEPRLLYPLELGGVLAAGFAARAADASQAHAEIGEAWRGLAHRPDGPELATIFARGHATPSRAVLSGGKLRVTRSDPEWLPNQGWRGDGTVPAISAIPPEGDDDRSAWYPVPERHLSMASTPAVIELLRFLDGAVPAPPPAERAGQPWIGLELDETVLPGEPSAMAAEVLGAAGDAASAWVTVRPAGRAGQPRRDR